jgi:hypothetical protein
MEALV